MSYFAVIISLLQLFVQIQVARLSQIKVGVDNIAQRRTRHAIFLAVTMIVRSLVRQGLARCRVLIVKIVTKLVALHVLIYRAKLNHVTRRVRNVLS